MIRDRIRWGIIGTGNVAEFKSGPALYKAANSELVAVSNRTRSRAESFSERHGDPRVLETAAELVQDEEVDAVYIGTAPDSHLELTQLAANAGKHVLCEKPMALNLTECDEMIRVCQRNDVSLCIAYYRRFFPVVQKAKNLLDEGVVGRPLSISAKTIAPFHLELDAWRLDPKSSGGGFLMDMGTHRLDLFAYLMGEPERIHGVARNQSWEPSVDDSAVVALDFKNGAYGSAVFHWNSAVSRDELEIVGSKGLMQIRELSGAGLLSMETISEGGQVEEKLWELPTSTPVHLHLVEQFVSHLVHGTPNPCAGESARIANQIVNEVYERM